MGTAASSADNNENATETGTILIVDDDPDYTRVVQLLLAKICPHLPTSAMHSGEELISYLQGEDRLSGRNNSLKPILVLLDVRMPGMDGFDVLRWLRDHPPHHRIPVVVLTSRAAKPNRPNALMPLVRVPFDQAAGPEGF